MIYTSPAPPTPKIYFHQNRSIPVGWLIGQLSNIFSQRLLNINSLTETDVLYSSDLYRPSTLVKSEQILQMIPNQQSTCQVQKLAKQISKKRLLLPPVNNTNHKGKILIPLAYHPSKTLIICDAIKLCIGYVG